MADSCIGSRWAGRSDGPSVQSTVQSTAPLKGSTQGTTEICAILQASLREQRTERENVASSSVGDSQGASLIWMSEVSSVSTKGKKRRNRQLSTTS